MVPVSLLEELKTFDGLTQEELEHIAGLCREEHYAAGAVIYKEGDVADELYVVLEGRIALEARIPQWVGASPTRVIVDVLARGEVFGKSALIRCGTRDLSPKCLEETKVIAMDAAGLCHMLSTHPHAGYKIMESISNTTAARLTSTRTELARFIEGERRAQAYAPEETALIQRVHYFVIFRWVAVVGVLSVALSARAIFNIVFPLLPVIAITGGIALYNLYFWFQAKTLGSERPASLADRARGLVQAQSVADLVALTMLLHFTGGVENPFIYYSAFHIIIASVLLPQKTAYLLATFEIALFSSLVGLEYLGILPHVHLEGFTSALLYRQPSYIAAILLSLGTVLYIATYMVGSIAAELRQSQREVTALKDRALLDIQALEEANTKLVELDRLRTHFLAIATHDLRAPLAAVQGYLRVMLEGFAGELLDDQREMLQRSSIRIDGLLALVNDLLDATHIETGRIVQEMASLSLADVVEDALENVNRTAAEKELQLHAEVPEDLPEIEGAARRLVQVLTNLLSNAVQYTPSGGKVIVRVTEERDQLRVEVMDTGTGICPEDLPRIFDEFYRGDNVETRGAGLGLSIAKQIVEAHGGEIWADSPYPESTTGSRFTVTLPRGPRGMRNLEAQVSFNTTS